MQSLKVKLVTFDVTNTLIGVANGGAGKQYALIAKKHGLLLDEIQLNKDFKLLFKQQNELYPSYGHFTSGMSNREWWMDLVRKLCLKQGLVNDLQIVDRFAFNLYDEFKSNKYWIKYDYCDEILDKLEQANITLGIISNFDERLEIILKDLNIYKYFKFILTPFTYNGLCKPNVNLFKEAYRIAFSSLSSSSSSSSSSTIINRHNHNLHEYVHIGDSYELDFKPCVSLGHRSILMLHNNYMHTHSFSGLNDTIINNPNLYAYNLIDLKEKLFI